MRTTKRNALALGRKLKRALEGCDRAFLFGLNPMLKEPADFATEVCEVEYGGLTLTLRFGDDGLARVDDACRYDAGRTSKPLTLPPDRIQYPSPERVLGLKRYRYSVAGIDAMLGEGRRYLRHLTRGDIIKAAHGIKFSHHRPTVLKRRGDMPPYECDIRRREIETAYMESIAPRKEDIGSVGALLKLFR